MANDFEYEAVVEAFGNGTTWHLRGGFDAEVSMTTTSSISDSSTSVAENLETQDGRPTFSSWMDFGATVFDEAGVLDALLGGPNFGFTGGSQSHPAVERVIGYTNQEFKVGPGCGKLVRMLLR